MVSTSLPHKYGSALFQQSCQLLAGRPSNFIRIIKYSSIIIKKFLSGSWEHYSRIEQSAPSEIGSALHPGTILRTYGAGPHKR